MTNSSDMRKLMESVVASTVEKNDNQSAMNEVSDEEMAAFKAKGGKVKNIPTGTSGKNNNGVEDDEDMMLYGPDVMNARRVKKMREEFDTYMK